MRLTFASQVLRLVRTTLSAGMLVGLLAGCSGADDSVTADNALLNPLSNNSLPNNQVQEHAAPDSAGSETDDRALISAASAQEIEAIGRKLYTRPYDYPYMVNLPPQFVPMSTGKKLSVKVTLPANEKGVPAEGPFPVILTQSGYNTNLLSMLFMDAPGNLMLGSPDYFMVGRGYVQVAVDALGTGASEGGWELFSEEEQTGFADMVDWVHQQSWFNGKLGVSGVSYMGISSLFAAQRRPDDIDAVFASLPLGDAMRGIAGTGGLLNGHFMSTWMHITSFLSTQHVPSMLKYPQYMNHYMKVTQEHVDHIDSYYVPLIQDALWGEPYLNYDGEFWNVRSPLTNIHKIKAPTFIFGALDDLFQRDEPLLYEGLKKAGTDARLVIYNGSHFPNFLLSHVGNEAVPPIDFLILQWFDKHLMGMETGTENIPPVVQYVKNYPTPDTPEQYRNDSYSVTTDWPHPKARAERWYLQGNNGLDREKPLFEQSGYMMTNPEPADVDVSRRGEFLAFDTTLKDGTECSRSYEVWILGLALPKSCYRDTTNTQQQRVLFESEPMEEDYYINGPIQADIWVESTVTEAVVSVQIEEVSSKRALPITNGQLLASVRAVDESRSRFMNGEMIQPYHYLTQDWAKPLVPGEVVKMQIEVFPTSAIIRRGNRLRVSISPSNQAQGMLNLKNREQAAGGVTTIRISPDYPSSVVLPVVPVSYLN